MKRFLFFIVFLALLLCITVGNAVAEPNYVIQTEQEVRNSGTNSDLWVMVYLENYGNEPTSAGQGLYIKFHQWYSNSSECEVIINDPNWPIHSVPAHSRHFVGYKIIPVGRGGCGVGLVNNWMYAMYVGIGGGSSAVGGSVEYEVYVKTPDTTMQQIAEKVNGLDSKADTLKNIAEETRTRLEYRFNQVLTRLEDILNKVKKIISLLKK